MLFLLAHNRDSSSGRFGSIKYNHVPRFRIAKSKWLFFKYAWSVCLVLKALEIVVLFTSMMSPLNIYLNAEGLRYFYP